MLMGQTSEHVSPASTVPQVGTVECADRLRLLIDVCVESPCMALPKAGVSFFRGKPLPIRRSDIRWLKQTSELTGTSPAKTGTLLD